MKKGIRIIINKINAFSFKIGEKSHLLKACVIVILLLALVKMDEKLLLTGYIRWDTKHYTKIYIDSLIRDGQKDKLLAFVNGKYIPDSDVIKDIKKNSEGIYMLKLKYSAPQIVSTPKTEQGFSEFFINEFQSLILFDIVTVISTITIYLRERVPEFKYRKCLIAILLVVITIIVSFTFSFILLWLFRIRWNLGVGLIKIVKYISMIVALFKVTKP